MKILAAVVVLLGAYAFYDYKHSENETKQKAEAAKLLTLNPDHINEIDIEKQDSRVVLKRTADGWNLEEPVRDNADNDGVEMFVSTAAGESAVDVAREGEGIDWALYGLDKPHSKIIFKTSDGRTATYAVSDKKNFEQNTFLRRDNENKVYVAGSAWQARGNKGALEFRDKRLLRHKIAAVEKMHWKSDRNDLSLESKDGRWILSKDPKRKLEQNKVRELLQNLSEAKAMDFMQSSEPTTAEKKKYFLDKPWATLVLEVEGKKWTAVLGLSRKHEIYALIHDPLFVLKIEPGPLEKFDNVQPDQLYAPEKGQASGTISTHENPEMKLKAGALPQEKK